MLVRPGPRVGRQANCNDVNVRVFDAKSRFAQSLTRFVTVIQFAPEVIPLRIVKSREEIKLTRRACEIAIEAFLKLVEAPVRGKTERELAACDGILIPGGFGVRGIEGKIRASRYAREEGVPFLRLRVETSPELRHAGLFADPAHLNEDGAAITTRLLAAGVSIR